ncbi:Protein of unknown function [Gryllus bimaculatus]|nr:Protein of unknown function [Gryllus bimaculatus]
MSALCPSTRLLPLGLLLLLGLLLAAPPAAAAAAPSDAPLQRSPRRVHSHAPVSGSFYHVHSIRPLTQFENRSEA